MSQAPRPAAGVQLARDETGGRSSTAVTRGVVAAALAPADPVASAAAAGERAWRTGYLRHVVALTAAGARSAGACLDIARAGLDALDERMVLVRDGAERPVREVLRESREPVLGTEVVRGEGERRRELEVPYRGQLLRGDALRRQLDTWVAAGVVEASFRTALSRVLDSPDWLDLSDRAVAVVGAGSEMGPLGQLLGWGAQVLAVDLPSERVWQRVVAAGRAGTGTLHVPVARGSEGLAGAGADLLLQAPELAAWLETTAPGLPLTIGSYAYAAGATHLRLAHAADALVVDLIERRPDVSYAELATPTDAFVVPGSVVDAARGRRPAGGPGGLLRGPVRTLSRGALLTPSYTRDVPTDDGRTVGVTDSLVPQQGPNYALAKRLQRWRALVARADGVLVSANVAPATRTRSVVTNRLLSAAYSGAHRFGVEVFEPETSRPLMAALLVHDLREPTAAGRPGQAAGHPDDLLVESAAHGGFWRLPYETRSVLPLAALAGVPSLLRR
jgi:hypothetical protein